MEKHFQLNEVKDQFRVWTQLMEPKLQLPGNVRDICFYGFTRALNNAVDHSHGHKVTIREQQDGASTHIEIEDDGVGVFAKLRTHFGLDSDFHALIELAKGKLTVAPEAHSGEGLFFASRVFDRFVVKSGELSALFTEEKCIVSSISHRQGTLIRMDIANNSTKTLAQVFNRFSDAEEKGFYRTRFPLSLAAIEGSLIWRSEAKRVSARLEQFAEVDLDFLGVDAIGKEFADELLREWPLAHPNTKLFVVNANDAVQTMIGRIKGQ